MAAAKKAAKAAPAKAAADRATEADKANVEETDVTGAPDSSPAAATKADEAEENPALHQFPSVDGHEDVEIAERSQDIHEPTATEHVKVFVVPRNPHGDDFDDDMHARNIDAMRQNMILQGLRPTEDGHFVGAEDHPDGQSVCLTYAVACVPAAVATPEEAQVRVTVEGQHDLEREAAQAADGEAAKA